MIRTQTTELVEIQGSTGETQFIELPEYENPHSSANNWGSCIHWMWAFLGMTVIDFEQWKGQTPEDQFTTAAMMAYNLVKNSRTSLRAFKLVANYTEGKPRRGLPTICQTN